MAYKISSSHLTALSAPDMVAECRAFEELVLKYTAAGLGVNAETFSDFRLYLTKLEDAVNATQGSDKTAVISQYDQERDNHYRFIRNVFDNLKNSTDSELTALYDLAKAKILKVYPASIANEAQNKETAHIVGFIVDVRKFFGANLAKLGIAEKLEALETANNNFQTAFLDRSDELGSILKGATDEYRKKLMEDYYSMELSINYNANSTGKDEDTVMRRDACQGLISAFNQYISELWQSVKLSKALKKGGSTTGGTSTGGTSTGTNTKPTGGTSSTGGSTSGGTNTGGLADLG